MTSLSDVSWPDVPQAATLLVPVGSTEQHGPHLPFDTDTAIAEAVCRQVAGRHRRVMVAPPVAIGSSGEHQDFRGTVSIGTEVLTSVVIEVVRSASTWAERILLVNAHGGNVAALDAAVRQVRSEGRDAAWVECATEDVDLHAGFTETSLMLHLRPASVMTNRAAAGDIRPLAQIFALLQERGVSAVSANGVLGDPSGASASAGRELLATMVDDVTARIEGWQLNDHGQLQRSALVATTHGH